MLVLTGTYNFLPRIVAFRSDFCRSCQSDTISFGRRTVDAFHVFWIPLVPLGIWTRWFCNSCGERPHNPTTVRRPVRLFVVFFFFLLSVMLWFLVLFALFTSVSQSPEARGFLVAALVMTVLLVLSIFWAWEFQSDKFKSRLSEVQPFSGHACPLCSGSLVISDKLTCRDCGAENRPLQ